MYKIILPFIQDFFTLNESNNANINLNNQLYITNINQRENYIKHCRCKIKNIDNNSVKEKTVFFKLAPLIDPFKYLMGKYELNDTIFTLPQFNSTTDCDEKILDVNNCRICRWIFYIFNESSWSFAQVFTFG